jgi:hypothetical protein
MFNFNLLQKKNTESLYKQNHNFSFSIEVCSDSGEGSAKRLKLNNSKAGTSKSEHKKPAAANTTPTAQSLTITALFKNSACKRSLKLNSNCTNSPGESGSETSVLAAEVSKMDVVNSSSSGTDTNQSKTGTPTKRANNNELSVDKENQKKPCITID